MFGSIMALIISGTKGTRCLLRGVSFVEWKCHPSLYTSSLPFPSSVSQRTPQGAWALNSMSPVCSSSIHLNPPYGSFCAISHIHRGYCLHQDRWYSHSHLPLHISCADVCSAPFPIIYVKTNITWCTSLSLNRKSIDTERETRRCIKEEEERDNIVSVYLMCLQKDSITSPVAVHHTRRHCHTVVAIQSF